MTERPLFQLDSAHAIWLQRPWPVALELSSILPERSWTLVGGLMVQLHAHIAGLASPRATTDVDSVLHLETEAINFAIAHNRLVTAGFVLDENTKLAYKFDREGGARVDVMASDVHQEHQESSFRGRRLFGVSGARRALQETWEITLHGSRIDFVVPSVRGAIVLKGAAALADQGRSTRHLEDAVLLFACLENPAAILADLSGRSRKRVLSLVETLTIDSEPWRTHDDGVQALAREALEQVPR